MSARTVLLHISATSRLITVLKNEISQSYRRQSSASVIDPRPPEAARLSRAGSPHRHVSTAPARCGSFVSTVVVFRLAPSSRTEMLRAQLCHQPIPQEGSAFVEQVSLP
jgi:hypothetical protein